MNRFIAIDIGQLRIGMYVQLEMGWLSHPFPANSFKITSHKQLQILQSLNLKQVQVDLSRSDPEEAAPAFERADQASIQETFRPDHSAEPTYISVGSAATLAQWRVQIQQTQGRFDEALQCFDRVQALVPASLEQARACSDAMVQDCVEQLLAHSNISLHLLFDASGAPASLHSVNTAVLSLLLGKTLGLSEAALRDLGVAALLHDLGKVVLDVSPLDCALSLMGERPGPVPMPYAAHVGESVALAQAMGYAPSVTTAIAQHHEWADGSGFPLGLLEADMELAGQILALVNNYERLCNPPRARAAMTPHEALSELYGSHRQRYSAEVLRAFVQTLGVYPPGSWVELSDSRQGQVLSVNTGQPLKPVVMVLQQGLSAPQPALVDLAQQLDLGIRRGLHKSQVAPELLSGLLPQKHLCYFFDSVSVPSELAAAAAEKAPL